MTDRVNSPPHYTGLPSGVECIDVTEHFNFNRGNAIKYIWRAGRKSNEIEDLEKAIWYLRREVRRLDRAEKVLDCGHERAARGERKGMGTPSHPEAVNRGIDQIINRSTCD